MQEHVLNGIIHVLAIFSVQAGKSDSEAGVLVRAYLTRMLSIQNPDVFLELFESLRDLYAQTDDSDAPRRGVEAISSRLNPVLGPEDKQFFLLQILALRQRLAADATGLSRSQELLSGLVAAMRIPSEEFEACSGFLAATPHAPIHDQTPASLIASQSRLLPHCRSIPDQGRPEGWRGELIVFRSPWTGRYFLRVLAGDFTLDENPLDLSRIYPLEPGAILRDVRGRPLYLFQVEQLFEAQSPHPPILFKAEEVNFRFPGSENGLHNLSFHETGGRLIGVMGGSGVGKSTLINILNGSLRPDSGRISVNGVSLMDHSDQLQGVVGYVPQDDLLFEDLTVQQNLDYNARLCLAHLDAEQRGQRVRRMLRELNQEEIAPLKVGGPLSKTISGGQRKRLNIALELIREPAILFVDEPTSGLSSADSDNVMGLLKAQAGQGRLIIVIIHQPSSALFRLFDALWVLDKGGYPIYMGHPLEATRYFREQAHVAGADRSICSECGNVNPEQLFTIIEAKSIDDQGRFTRQRTFSPVFWHEAWRRACSGAGAPNDPASPEMPPPRGRCAPSGNAQAAASQDGPAPALPAESLAPPPVSLVRPGWLGQLGIFFSRTLQARLANRAYLLVNLLEPPLLGLLTAWICRSSQDSGYTFGDNSYIPVYFFMVVIVALFLGLSVSAEEIVRDRRILRRERFLHLSWSAYAGAKIGYISLLALLQTAVCAAIGAYLLQIPDFFIHLWAVLFSIAAFGGLLGLNISAIFKNAVTVYILIPLLLIPQMLLGGLIIAFDDLRPSSAANAYPPLIGELTATRWAFEALAVQQYQGNAYQQRHLAADRELSRLDYLHNDLIPALIGRLDALYLDALDPDQRDATHALIRRELSDLAREYPQARELAQAAANLTPPDRTGLDALKAGLRDWAGTLQAQRREVQDQRREIHAELLAEYGNDGLSDLVKKHSNRKISDMVRNKSQLAPYRLHEQRIVRLSDPIFQQPTSPLGRAPFMAGEKRLGSFTLPTFAFNLLVLWLMNAGLALLLIIPKGRFQGR